MNDLFTKSLPRRGIRQLLSIQGIADELDRHAREGELTLGVFLVGRRFEHECRDDLDCFRTKVGRITNEVPKRMQTRKAGMAVVATLVGEQFGRSLEPPVVVLALRNVSLLFCDGTAPMRKPKQSTQLR